MSQGFRFLTAEHKAAIADAAAKPNAGATLARHMAIALMLGDHETCTYITAKHFDALPPEVQQELRSSGLKQVSDTAQQILDRLQEQLENPAQGLQTPAVPGTDTVH